ncbi:MAG: RluA family pseudouridine synthase [Candidatus Cellulosilyticum pullistercoris]|uniref:Pseudouridine synthase n=1 Tax=Candidatus Cellulosilyticum pullistercoris TaxID=2838521 RepID=A0A9E2KF19_9FIRM|nr:RluA family pseudouridine synthase [Candidatus Cellulosilyticum pullistercoris]
MSESIKRVVEEQAGIRLDKYLAQNLTDYTRSFLQKQIEQERVRVNGKVVGCKYQVKLNDEIEIIIPDPVEVDIVAEDIPIEIVYEDDDLMVINKPQDMVVHPAPGNYTGTLVNALLYHCKDQLSGINGEIRPGIVHRIDKDTSGLLMIAKNDKAHLGLSEMLKTHDIIRKYHAIVYGSFKENEGTVELPIGRSPQDRKKMAIVQDGRYAKTDYRVIERFKNFTHIELTLHTGRTHQIRVHMKAIGHPLLGDPVYGPTKSMFGLNKQMLHAKVLGFIHPISGEKLYFESELPSYFISVIDRLRKL